MFGFGKISQPELAKRIVALAGEASEQFHDYLKEDSVIYSKCITQTPIKNTGAVFMVNIYRDMLSSKYVDKDVYLVIRTAILMMGTNKTMQDMLWQCLMDYWKACNDGLDYYKQLPGYDPIAVLTKTYFSLVFDDRIYLQNELERAIPQSVSYRKIYDYINGVIKHKTLLDDKYKMKLL